MQVSTIRGTMTKYICNICKKEFDDTVLIFGHIIDDHVDVIENDYIIEDNEENNND